VSVFASATALVAGHVGFPSPGTRDRLPLPISRPHTLRFSAAVGVRHQSPQEVTPSVEPAQVAGAAASQIRSERPVRITLPSGATMRVLPAATGRTGVLQVPDDIGSAGWWDGGSRVGDPYGPIVVAAHVDSFTQGIGKFAELLGMHPGQEVLLESPHLVQRFVVESAELVPKTSLATDSQAFAPGGDGRLVLITCGGTYDPDQGGYQDNMVVVASPEKAPRARHS
jgi:Sortase domain